VHVIILAQHLDGAVDGRVRKFTGNINSEIGNADDILTRTMHAFIHFFLYSQKDVLFYDLQGK
jgi:hypothetical protein